MSFFTRLRDPLLSLLKDEQPQGQPRDRAEAARRAWEVRRARFGPGGGNRKGYGKGKHREPAPQAAPQPQPEAQRGTTHTDQELASVATSLKSAVANKGGKLGDAIPWAKKLGAEDKGKSPAGFIDVGGKRYFAKVSEVAEAEVEEAVWNASKALGWEDLSRPTKSFIARDDRGDRHAETAISVQPLLPEGDQMRRMDASDIHIKADKLERMKVFEYAIGAVDRHGGNYWVDKKGDVHGIDYARSFYDKAEAEEFHGQAGGSDKWEGLWGRSATRSTVIAREHIQKIVDNADKIIAAIPPNGGFRTSRQEAISALNVRITKLKNVLSANLSARIDLKKEHVWH